VVTRITSTAGDTLEASNASGAACSVEPSVLRLSYALLPLVWAGILTHYEELMLSELGLLLPRLAVSLGATPDATWINLLPTASLSPAAIDAVQACGLLLGATLSWVLAGKIAAEAVGPAAAGRVALSQRVFILATAAELWQLIV
jgi:hypothetical protein